MTARKEDADPRRGREWKRAQNAREDAAALALDIEAQTTAALYVPGIPAAAARLVGDSATKAQKLRQRLTEHDQLSQELYARTTPAGSADAVHNRRKEDNCNEA